MKNETETWMQYAEENLSSARVLCESDLYNPSLQNAQQAVEKALKALLIEYSLPFRKTHSISELVVILSKQKTFNEIAQEECDLLDSIYLPSKYPLGSVLPYFEPDEKICRQCLDIAEKTLDAVRRRLSTI